MFKLVWLNCCFLCVTLAQSTTLVFNNGQPYQIQVSANSAVTVLDDATPTLTSTVPTNVQISVQDAPWLSAGVLQDGHTCDDGSSPYAPRIRRDQHLYKCNVVFPGDSSPDQSPGNASYLPQGWYTGYLRVAFVGGVVLFPVHLQVIPTGYLHLQDGNGNPLDGAATNLDATSPLGLAIYATINTNATDDQQNPPPSSVNFTFSATDSATGMPATWLRISDGSGNTATSPETTPCTFHLVLDLSKIASGTTQLSANFNVKSTNGFQDSSTVTIQA